MRISNPGVSFCPLFTLASAKVMPAHHRVVSFSELFFVPAIIWTLAKG